MMLMCNSQILHNHMIEHFDYATEGNRYNIGKESEENTEDVL
jgi:hypothetical protein